MSGICVCIRPLWCDPAALVEDACSPCFKTFGVGDFKSKRPFFCFGPCSVAGAGAVLRGLRRPAGPAMSGGGRERPPRLRSGVAGGRRAAPRPRLISESPGRQLAQGRRPRSSRPAVQEEEEEEQQQQQQQEEEQEEQEVFGIEVLLAQRRRGGACLPTGTCGPSAVVGAGLCRRGGREGHLARDGQRDRLALAALAAAHLLATFS
eukprot:SAG22_NODE_49_length_24620_cov_80.053587_26_plen_206_part_00